MPDGPLTPPTAGARERLRRGPSVVRAAAVLLAVMTIALCAIVIGNAGTSTAASPLLAAPTPSATEPTGTSLSPTVRSGSSTSSAGSSATGSTAVGSTATDSESSTGSVPASTDTSSGSVTSGTTDSSSPGETTTSTSPQESGTIEGEDGEVPTSVGSTVVPATPPAAAQSAIGRGTVLIAVAVLIIALAILAVVINRTRGRRPPGSSPAGKSSVRQGIPAPTSQSTPTAPLGIDTDGEPVTRWTSAVDGSSLTDLMALLVELGGTMVDSGDPVSDVSDRLRRVAAANGAADAEIIVLPTALIITLPGMQESRTEVAVTGQSRLRLDQVDAVFTVADAAERGEIGPRDALTKLRSARSQPPSFGPAVIVGGHAVIAVGLAVILSGGWTELGVAAGLGAVVGLIKYWSERRITTIQVFLPVVCAMLVAAAVALLARTPLDPAILPPILGALVTFIPGGLLTTAVIELATGQMISGASRFLFGVLQLVLLSLGIVGGLQLVGMPAITVGESDPSLIAAVAPWLGVLVFGVGVLLSYSGRPRSLGWMLLVLYVAYAGQVVGGLLFGASLSAFVGATLMTPVAVFVANQRSGPPTLVTFLPAFWLLVPGAIALVGVTQVMSDARVDGVSSLLGAGVTIISIALGVVLGLSVGDWIGRLRRGAEKTPR